MIAADSGLYFIALMYSGLAGIALLFIVKIFRDLL